MSIWPVPAGPELYQPTTWATPGTGGSGLALARPDAARDEHATGVAVFQIDPMPVTPDAALTPEPVVVGPASTPYSGLPEKLADTRNTPRVATITAELMTWRPAQIGRAHV